MRSKIGSILIVLLSVLSAHAEVTIEQCVEKAIANYPLVRKYNLIAAASEIELSDINKGWLPRIGVNGQITVQNAVPSFPEALTGVLHNMGQNIKGMSKTQYKAGVDISQTLWDGGASKARRELTASLEAVQSSVLDVELYQLRQRVENLFFAILLIDAQTEQSRVTYNLLCRNLEKLRSMLQNGVATQSDVDMMEAQALTLNQNISQAQTASAANRKALAILTGQNLENQKLAMPVAEMPLDTGPDRPELTAFARQMAYNQAVNRLADASLMPRIGLFAQGYYGYPGFNYFESMMNRRLSLNLMAGIKVSWNIDSFYTKKNTSARTALQNVGIETDKELFLFNTKIQSASQTETVKGIQLLIKDDSRIVELRSNVRMAAESQLANGVIDITALLTKISDENSALLTSRYHRILLLQEIYKLKYTLDR